MPFPFTFIFSVPGLSNPFSKPPISPPSLTRRIKRSNSATVRSESEDDMLNLTPKQSHLSQRQASPQPNPRKRGWEPSSPEPTHSTTQTTLVSSNGYLDTPAKYRQLAEGQVEEAFEYIRKPGSELDDALQPPAKRRRGLAGSIVSTALSAALIGTAVGLTVYRLWRDRGKAHAPLTIAHEQPPPPPYSETEPHSQSIDSSSIPNTPDLNVIPPTPNRRHHPHRQPRSAPRRRRGGPSRAANPSFTPSSSSNAIFPNTQPQFDFSFQSSLQSSSHQPVNEVEDQMDWIGDKLSMLIQEGKRALGREVVVSSECAEDEVDDGSGGWIEEDEDGGHHGKSRSSSPRRVRRKGSQRRLQEIRHSPSSSFSGSQPSTSLPSSPSFSSTFPTSQSVPSYMSLGTDTAGSSSAYESADIQESMERARRKVLEARAARAAGAPFS